MSVSDSWGGPTAGYRETRKLRAGRKKVPVTAATRADNLFRVLIEHTSDIVTVVAADGRITYQSPSCRRVLGYAPEELIGTSSFALIHPDDMQWAMALFSQHVDMEGVTPAARIRLRHRNGAWVWLEAVGNNLLHEPDVAGMVFSSRDISAQVRAEQALKESQRWLETVVGGAPIVIFAFDRDGIFTLSAGSGLAALGSTPGAVVGRSMFELYKQTPSVEAAARRALVGEQFQTLVETNDLAWMVEFGPLRDSTGTIAGGVGVATDITKTRKAQRETAESLEREAQVMTAIARVGQELIACLDTAAVVDRLCRVTTEVLQCDFCEIRFLDPARDAFVMAAAFGLTTEEHEALRPITLPRTVATAVAQELWAGHIDDLKNEQLRQLARQYGASGVLAIPLRRGQELIGIQCASFRHREARFTAPQVQIARAIGQLAAMALENARLIDELQQASRLKSEFVATMSHELRTPLNVIIGYTDLLLEESFGALTAEQQQVCRRVERSAGELLALINATLDLGRLESGRLPVDLQDVALSDLLTSVENETQEYGDKPSVRLSWRVNADLPLVRTDPVKLKVILKNLIANAVKFTPAGEVVVSISPHEAGFELVVRDTGIGIATEAQSIIFEPFRQADGSMSRRFGGVGLGLYIVRRLVDVLGGTVTVDSEVGRGSTFRVLLPAGGPPGTARGPRVGR